MSRIGKLPVTLKEGVSVQMMPNSAIFSGKLGKVEVPFNSAVKVELKDKEICVTPLNKDEIFSRSMWGTMRALLENANIGVSEGFKKELEFKGVGYKVQVQGQKLVMALGYSHPVEYTLKPEVKAQAQGVTGLILTSCVKGSLGQTLSEIQKFRPPEPYKGKGIHIKGEFVRRKEGKKK